MRVARGDRRRTEEVPRRKPRDARSRSALAEASARSLRHRLADSVRANPQANRAVAPQSGGGPARWMTRARQRIQSLSPVLRKAAQARPDASPAGCGRPAATAGVLKQYVGGSRGTHAPARLDGWSAPALRGRYSRFARSRPRLRPPLLAAARTFELFGLRDERLFFLGRHPAVRRDPRTRGPGGRGGR